jgi:hypothetical protein
MKTDIPLIQWNASLSVTIDEIDKQHQKLFALINDFSLFSCLLPNRNMLSFNLSLFATAHPYRVPMFLETAREDCYQPVGGSSNACCVTIQDAA